MRTSANHYGLMKVFGSRPKENFGEILAYAKNKTLGTPERIAIDKWEPALDNRFAVVSGEADRPIANMWSGIVNGVMAVQRMAKLGLTPFAMLQDNVTISRELARQGMGFLDRNGSMLSPAIPGRRGHREARGGRAAAHRHSRPAARRDGALRHQRRARRHDGEAGEHVLQDHRHHGDDREQARRRRADDGLLDGQAARQGLRRARRRETRTLQSFGIGDKEWALLHKADWNGSAARRISRPTSRTRLSTPTCRPISTRGPLDRRARAGRTAAVTRSKRGLGRGARSRAARSRDEAVGLLRRARAVRRARGRARRKSAILYQGTQAGSPLNTALRLLLQFKQFPTAMITKAWGAEIYGGARGHGPVAGITELIVGSTLFGMAANYLNQAVKGQDPNSQWRNNPANAMLSGFLRGGAASIYGDFLLGEWSRHGQQALEMLAGPTVGQINQVFEIWADLTHMKKGAATAALAARMARNNLPFANMIYTKAAIDYLIFYRFMEWLNPGYLERMERTMKDKSGTEFWLKPTQVAR
jgi:hypothetical protein